MDHNKVIEKIRSGSEEELTLVYKKYRKEFINWITRTYSCSIDDAKDIYQVTIISFSESIASGKLIRLDSSLKTYLFAIGKNKLQEQRRYTARQEIIVEKTKEEHSRQSETNEDEEAAFSIIEKCLESLGDPCKSILILFYYNKLSITEITEKLNYKNTDTSKNLKYKCLKRLRKIYDGQEENSKKYE